MKRKSSVFLALFMLIMTGCADSDTAAESYAGKGYTFSYDADKWELAFEAEDGTVCLYAAALMM